MEFLGTIIKSPFVWGLAVGLFFVGMSIWSHLKTRREFSRYKKLLADKMEL